MIMGVLNVTPDSFYDGGRFISEGSLRVNKDKALISARDMWQAGAHIIDVGGESTRPGAKAVSLQEEMDRVLPVVEAISEHAEVIISVDTSRPEIMKAAASAGAGLLNDVRAFTEVGALNEAASLNLPICIMHMQGEPGSMQNAPIYNNVLNDVKDYLAQRVQAALEAGIDKQNIMVDPGFGFGKTDEHNLLLLRHLSDIGSLGFPVLAGLSRKSMIGRLLGREPSERLAGSLALAMLAAQAGAGIIRVHDVPQTRDVLKMLEIFSG